MMKSKQHAKELAKKNAGKKDEQNVASREEAKLQMAKRETEKAKSLGAERITMEKNKEWLDSFQETDVEAVMNRKREKKARTKAEKRERKAQQEQEMLRRNSEQRRC
jgi:hypothetical protein